MDRRLLPLVELASVLLTLSIVVGFHRLFEDDSFVAPLVVVALVTHGLAILLRRTGRGLALTALTTMVVVTGLITVTHYRDTARGFIPTGATREAFRTDLQTAWDTFGEVAAPTEALTGFVVMASIGIWLCAFLVDWAAFRLGSKVETLLPPAALFGFQAVVGGDRARIASAVCFGAAAILFVLTHRVCSLERDGRWLAEGEGQGSTALLRGGAVLSVVAVLVGLGVGPLLPGAEDEPLVELDPSGDGDGTRWVENPLVDIRNKLFEQSDSVMFTVSTVAAPDYWRMISLHEFDGDQWSTSDTYVDAETELASGQPEALGTEWVNQIFTMVNMVSNWLPAAYEARSVVAPDFSPNWSPNTGALLMPRDRPLESGDYYTVVSQVPDRDLAAVTSPSADIPAEIADVYLDLPNDFSTRVRQEAQDIVDRAGATTAYEKALALQNFFLEQFTYDLDVAEGHSNADIEEFVFDLQRGYCEQFSGSFAAMARAIGLPSRVAVGFTPGEYNPEGGYYVVRGTHAHAWPEVWFPDAGWVRFEPTPQRGLPRDEPLTQVPPVPIPEVVPDPADTEGVTVPTTQPPPTVTTPADAAPPAGGEAGLLFVGLQRRTSLTPLVIALVVVVLLVAAAALLFGIKRRDQHRRQAGDAPVRVQIGRAWDDALDSLVMTGTNIDEAETANEFSRRAADRVDDTTASELRDLAVLTTVAQYSGDEMTPERGEDARRMAAAIRGYCNTQVTRSRRLLWELDPRPLFRPRHRP
ncbi:MAG: transglutaminaseTgpA domain-containing protein [Acidimicrobiales bacterium]